MVGAEADAIGPQLWPLWLLLLVSILLLRVVDSLLSCYY